MAGTVFLFSVAFSAAEESLLPAQSAMEQVPESPDLLYPDRAPREATRKVTAADWLKIIREQIPPLTHPRGNRWPLLIIAGVGFEPLPVAEIRMLLERGITQHLELKSSAIGAARRLKEAGAPVILTDGRNGAWPYNLEKDKTQWAHQYPAKLDVQPHWRDLPSPPLFRGWAVAAEQLRTTLNRFRQEQVPVDAIWLDYENEPSTANYYAAILSPSTLALMPPQAVADEASFRRYSRQLWIQLLSTYIAGPAREMFPKVSITNWVVTLSSPERPVLGWMNEPHPPMGATLFTATNPVAYGIDTAFLALWQKSYRLDQEHVDQFYSHILLRQVSADSANRQQQAPYLASIPWVGRWVADHPDKRVPILSRERYREVLRHLWLRGIDGMQVFNPVESTATLDMAVAEVQDAAAVYDEMLAYRDFLEKGTVLQLAHPAIQEDAALWSGLRLQDEAIVRLFWQGGAIGSLEIEPWPGSKVTLSSPTRGATFRLRRDKKNNTIEIVSVRR
ncbi:MAG: hypothetical protein HQL88_03870 [Magnetococcales bacterium]|nr:hypothetical protein [Magnetococcales bacterium]